jgi:hypothetical protein
MLHFLHGKIIDLSNTTCWALNFVLIQMMNEFFHLLTIYDMLNYVVLMFVVYSLPSFAQQICHHCDKIHANASTIITWNKNVDSCFHRYDFGHAMLVVVLLHSRALSVGLECDTMVVHLSTCLT